MTNSLVRLRRRLNAWYAATLGTIVILLGTGLFIAIREQLSTQLDDSLGVATEVIQRATAIRERERTTASGNVMDAVAELRIPDRELYLFGANGSPVVPNTAPAAIATVALAALRDSLAIVTLDAHDDHALRVYAARFHSEAGKMYVAVAVADQIGLQDQYAELIVSFGATALGALVLFAVGGSFLTRKSMEPVERTMSYMRRFMADAAHELRTPLAVVRSRAEVALGSENDGNHREALEAIEREAIRLGKIVEDLLLLARSDSEGATLELKRLFLDDVTSDAVGAASALATNRGVTLTVEGFEEAPVEGDAALVRQLLMILLDNAVKFTPPGGTVTVSVTNSSTGGVVTISDTGPGIPADQIEHVFERFYRGDTSRARGEGTGLGLSIAQWIADTHHARITLHAADAHGTIAEVRFPPVTES